MCTALFWFRLISEALRAGGLGGGGGVRAASTVHHAHQYAEGSSSKKIAPFYRPITETDFTGGSWSEHRWIRKVRSLDYPRIWYCRWRAWESSVLCVGGVLGSRKWCLRSLLSAPSTLQHRFTPAALGKGWDAKAWDAVEPHGLTVNGQQ